MNSVSKAAQEMVEGVDANSVKTGILKGTEQADYNTAFAFRHTRPKRNIPGLLAVVCPIGVGSARR